MILILITSGSLSHQTKLRHQYCCPSGPDRIKVQQPPGLEEPLFQVSWSLNTPVYVWHCLMVETGNHWSASLMLNTCICICRYTGTTPNPPPGSHYTSPSENMWNTGAAYSMSQGMSVSGEDTRTLIHVFSLSSAKRYSASCCPSVMDI